MTAVLVETSGVRSAPLGNGAVSFADLVAAAPSPSVGQVAAIARGGIVEYTAAGWLGDLGGVATPAALPAIAASAPNSVIEVGDFGMGRGGKMRREGARWAVRKGETLYAAVDPFSVANAPNTNAQEWVAPSIPVGVWGDGESIEIVCMVYTAPGNTAADTFTVLLGGNQLISPWGLAINANNPVIFRLSRNGNLVRRTQVIIGNTIYVSAGSWTFDFSAPLALAFRIGPAAIGDSTYLRSINIERRL